MSVSLYYTAKRDQPISRREQEACWRVVERYTERYPWRDMYEPFCVCGPEERSGEDVIFEGSTKLPVNRGPIYFRKVQDYWADCLQEIIDLLPGAQWYIRIDDADVTPYFNYPQS